jgi:hypothetical protein
VAAATGQRRPGHPGGGGRAGQRVHVGPRAWRGDLHGEPADGGPEERVPGEPHRTGTPPACAERAARAAFLAQIIAATSAGTTEASKISDELRAIDARRDELARDYARRLIDRKEWLAARDELASQADWLTSELARTQHGRALADFAAMDGHLWDRWDTLTTGGKRALIAAVVHHIDIRPAGHRRFGPDRITDPTWAPPGESEPARRSSQFICLSACPQSDRPSRVRGCLPFPVRTVRDACAAPNHTGPW